MVHLQRLGMESAKGFAGLSLDAAGSSAVSTAPDVDADGVPYLVSLHSDAQVTEKVKYKLRSGDVSIGSGGEADFQLGGIYVMDKHAVLSCEQVLELAKPPPSMRAGAAVKKGAGFCKLDKPAAVSPSCAFEAGLCCVLLQLMRM